MKIAYLMSRYPKLTETFIVNEISSLLEKGIDITLYPINKEKFSNMQPRAEALLPRVVFTSLVSVDIIKANLKLLFTKPFIYFRLWFNVTLLNKSNLNFLLGVLAYYPKAVYLASLCRSHQITHVHAHFANHPTMIAYVINQLTGIGYSFTAHGSDLHKSQIMLTEKYQCAKFAVMISKYNANFFARRTGIKQTDKLHLVRCGIDSSQFSYSDKTSFAMPVNILCVAALREVKGHRYLIGAARILKQANLSFKMNFVGDGPERAELQKMIAKLSLENEVILHGGKTQDEVAQLMKNADIFTLASFKTPSGNREGIPVVIMEAMASGTPVVASNVSGIPELVINQQTGLLATPQDSKDFADKFRQLIENPELAFQLAKRAHLLVKQDFDLNKNTDKLCELFHRYQTPKN